MSFSSNDSDSMDLESLDVDTPEKNGVFSIGEEEDVFKNNKKNGNELPSSVVIEREITDEDRRSTNIISFWRTNSMNSDSSNHHPTLHHAASVPANITSMKMHWLDGLQKAKVAHDPWEKHRIIETCPAEKAKRLRYNALKKKWVQDYVDVRMQNESFGQGAMRKCYRMKKLSTLCHVDDWKYASNMVAKRYIEDVLPKTYFNDVKLQMDAKLWAHEYNLRNPPKKIDIIQVSILELIERQDSPLYHIEHFVEGKYVKYNSNSGFVLNEDENIRSTPQAFSHFTFERSGHQVIVVDVQGVGDLYTDPQIHTANAHDYGEANLGTKGMALFFASHQCTNICEDLNLEMFDLSNQEYERINTTSSNSSTSTEVKPHLHNEKHRLSAELELVEKLQSLNSSSMDLDIDNTESSTPCSVPTTQSRLYSEADSITSEDEDNQHTEYFQQHSHKAASVSERERLTSESINERLQGLLNYEEQQISILGNIHYELAVYSSIGRFTDGKPDNDSVLFHLEHALLCGSPDANHIMSYKYFNIVTDEFADLVVEENHNKGMTCLIESAIHGNRDAMMRTAKAYDTGVNLGEARERSWTQALKWYAAALNQTDVGADAIDSYPKHSINARMAEIWREGGYGVEKDPSYAGELYTTAADNAMNSGQGKLANKYFILAEEAWGEVEEE